jgi:hypothetical protein
MSKCKKCGKDFNVGNDPFEDEDSGNRLEAFLRQEELDNTCSDCLVKLLSEVDDFIENWY